MLMGVQVSCVHIPCIEDWESERRVTITYYLQVPLSYTVFHPYIHMTLHVIIITIIIITIMMIITQVHPIHMSMK